MSGPRDTNPVEFGVAPGLFTNATDRAGKNRWKDCQWVRWHKGYAEKMGGYGRQVLSGSNSGVYLGVARALHDWSAIDSQQFIGVGTHLKLYLVNTGTLYDITPVRKTSNLANPFTTANGTPTVTVVDVDNRANVGDYITITDATAVGGLTLSGPYPVVSVVNADTYTITAAGNASSTATGGGNPSIAYDIYPGLADNGELLGYGTGTYGSSTYGTPRAPGSGIPAKLRTWSLDNWGEDLIASPSKGGIYWWDRTTGPSSRALLLDNAPTDVLRVLLNADSGYVIALGCSDLSVSTNFDPMLVRWCKRGDFTVWQPDSNDGSSAAGFYRLGKGSRIVTGAATRTQNLIWTDNRLYGMDFNGSGFGFADKGKCKIVGPNAMVDVNGTIYFWGFDDFFTYDGTLQTMPCDVWTVVMQDFNRAQAEKVFGASYSTKNEVTWYYPSQSGGGECDRYVTYNIADHCWYTGALARTCYHDVTPAITGFSSNPYAAYGGYLWTHESGLDQVAGGVTTPIPYFLESWDASLGSSDFQFLVNALIPDLKRMAGSINFTLKAKSRPRDAAYITKGPYVCTTATTVVGVRIRGSQIALRIDNLTNGGIAPVGSDFRLGVLQIQSIPYGQR